MATPTKKDESGINTARATAERIKKESEEEKTKTAEQSQKTDTQSKQAEVAEQQADISIANDQAEENKVELVKHETIAPAEIKGDQIIFTPKHLELIKNQIAKDATQEEYDLFIMMARRTRLDPLLKQLYFIKYKGKNGNPDKVSYVTSIDSYRIIAHRTGDFAGVDLPIFDYDKSGKITHAAITVYKLVQGQKFGFSAKVKFSEYNTNQNQWISKPETMIAKVAEAHALRKAFPQDLSGIYTTDEMEQAGVVVDGNSGKVIQQVPVKMITKAQVAKIKELMVDKGIEVDRMKKIVSAGYKRDTMAKLSMKQAGHLIGKLELMPDAEVIDGEIEGSDDEAIPDDSSFEDFARAENAKSNINYDSEDVASEVANAMEAAEELAGE